MKSEIFGALHHLCHIRLKKPYYNTLTWILMENSPWFYYLLFGHRYLFYYEVLILHLYNEYDYNTISKFYFLFQLVTSSYIQIQSHFKLLFAESFWVAFLQSLFGRVFLSSLFLDPALSPRNGTMYSTALSRGVAAGASLSPFA